MFLDFTWSKALVFFAMLLTFLLASLWLWLRHKMFLSKNRFIGISISSMLSVYVVFALLYFENSIMIKIFNHIYILSCNYIGTECKTLDPGTRDILAMLLTFTLGIIVVVSIYRFSSKVLPTWEGPTSKIVRELAREGQDNNFLALGRAELVRITKRQPDLPVSLEVLNWSQRISDPPGSPSWPEFCRELCLAALEGDVEIPESDWSERRGMWRGTVLVHDKVNILYLAPISGNVSEEKIKYFISEQMNEIQYLKYKLIVVFDSDEFEEGRHIIINGVNAEIWTKNSMLRAGLKLHAYARDLVRRYERDVLGGTGRSLSDTFIPSHLYSELSADRLRLDDVIREWLLDRSRRQIAIIGDYGQGKSTAMLEYCYQWALNYIERKGTESRIPLLIELRGKSPGETKPLELIAIWASRFGIRPLPILNLVKSGNALVIFEGFDELRNAGRTFDRHKHFNAMWAIGYPGTKIIFTGRPNFFLDEPERNRTLRNEIEISASGMSFTQVYKMAELSKEEILAIARRFDTQFEVWVRQFITQNKGFHDIVSRPSMLPVLATIWPELSRNAKNARDITNSTLIDKYIHSMYLRKEAELEKSKMVDDSTEAYLFLPYQIRDVLTLHVAWYMACKGLQNTIDRDSFDSVISDNFKDVIDGLVSQSSEPAIAVSIREFEERNKEKPKPDVLGEVSNEVASAGLMVIDPAGGPSNLRFPHKQFFDFLVAKAIWFQIQYPKSQISYSLRNVSSLKNPMSILQSNPGAVNFLAQIDRGRLVYFRRFSITITIIMLAAVFSMFRKIALIELPSRIVSKKTRNEHPLKVNLGVSQVTRQAFLSRMIESIDRQLDKIADHAGEAMYSLFRNLIVVGVAFFIFENYFAETVIVSIMSPGTGSLLLGYLDSFLSLYLVTSMLIAPFICALIFLFISVYNRNNIKLFLMFVSELSSHDAGKEINLTDLLLEGSRLLRHTSRRARYKDDISPLF